MRGRTVLVNSFISLTTKQSPLGPQDTTFTISVSSSILYLVRAWRFLDDFKYAPVQFFDEIARDASFARFLFGIGRLGLGLALEFILNERHWVLNGRYGTLGGVVAGGRVKGGYGG